MMNKDKLIAVLKDLGACPDSFEYIEEYDSLTTLYDNFVLARPWWLAWLGVSLEPGLFNVLYNELMTLEGVKEIWHGFWDRDTEENPLCNYANDLVLYLFDTSSQVEVVNLIKKHIPMDKLLQWCEVYHEAYVVAHHPTASGE